MQDDQPKARRSELIADRHQLDGERGEYQMALNEDEHGQALVSERRVKDGEVVEVFNCWTITGEGMDNITAWWRPEPKEQ